MQNYFSKCDGCNKKKFHICHRTYNIKAISQQPVTSNGKLCRKCYKSIKNFVKKSL